MPELEITSTTVGRLVVLLLAVSLHEAAHAYVGHWLGDPTPRERGRVTLNPLPHLHPVMSVLLPALLIFTQSQFIFGAGRPVPITMDRLKHPARDFALVAAAGPLANFLQVLVYTLVYVALRKGETPLVDPYSVVITWCQFGIIINLLLAFFNLIPIPPLDGSRLVAYLLPPPVRPLFYRLDPVGFLILIGLVFFTPVISAIMAATYHPVLGWWSDLYLIWIY